MTVRTKIIAGNWKMNNGIAETGEFFTKLETWFGADEIGKKAAAAVRSGKIEIVVAPVLTSIATAVASAKKGCKDLVGISAQNAYFEKKGAFTGEVSLGMLEEAGCKYVILGHSERRHVFGESDELLQKKLAAALVSKLLPIFCVGELLSERESGKTNDVLKKQLNRAWLDTDGDLLAEKLAIAYEPVWAIGTGKTASSDDAQNACAFIRELIAETFGINAAEKIRILYGGSVKAENSAGILEQNDIDGLLIGGASVEAESFAKIITAAL
ncbi:MAG: triose-phosphate isomerase [Synergistaceae bacterium]|jgi:triosephosphate isomerase|nr:triose-phosphate isomerase [Synergistaceae bacterium]